MLAARLPGDSGYDNPRAGVPGVALFGAGPYSPRRPMTRSALASGSGRGAAAGRPGFATALRRSPNVTATLTTAIPAARLPWA